MIFIALKNFRIRKLESSLFIVFSLLVILLSVVVEMETFGKATGRPILATYFTSAGYIVRPILLYVFVLLANMNDRRWKYFYHLCVGLLILNAIVFILPLFTNVSALSHLVFYYELNGDGSASFHRGTFLNFTSHIVSVFFLGVIIYISMVRFHGKHRKDGLVLLICAAFITATVLVETFTGRNDLLNLICEICAIVNYVFIVSVNTSRDFLTGLYDRRTFYEDSTKYRSSINGVIEIDMNGLKFINDHYGHLEGDKALAEIAKVFLSCIDRRTMFVYRLSGDEFIILMIKGKKETLERTVSLIQEEMEKSKYSIAIGARFIEEGEKLSFEELIKEGERLMYEDKSKFYKETGYERRGQNIAH